MSDVIIPGLKLICHNASRFSVPDDPSFPYKLEVELRPPEFMTMAFIGMFGGSENIVVRSMTKEALDEFIQENNLRCHSRLRKLVTTGPEGIIKQIP